MRVGRGGGRPRAQRPQHAGHQQRDAGQRQRLRCAAAQHESIGQCRERFEHDQLAGQLIVFETLAALAYAFVLRGRAPQALTLAGVALLVAGVLWALRTRPAAAAADAHPN